MEAASALLGKIVQYVINPAILLIFAAGFVLFLWGLVLFIWNLQSGEASNPGKQHMLYGLIGMLIMVSVYGIVTLIDDTFGFGAVSGSGASTDTTRLNDITAPCIFSGC
ncbi:MAG: hypothetical protein JO019_01655 [Candidatus Kaiserbacteria bacterium]|nr:hypothetical protein [Candidatus Kaiserbacteria bacterium]